MNNWFKKIALVAGLLLGSAFGQTNVFPALVDFAGVPTGSCQPDTFALNDSNGDLYTCVLGVWTKVGSSTTTSATRHLYVDGTRTDSYVATGAIGTPFKTISAAVSQVVTNGDNSTNCYVIDVHPATYVETVDIGNTSLFCLLFDGHGRSGTTKASQGSAAFNPAGATISPSSGNSFQSLSNNNQYTAIQVTGFNLTNAVNVTNTTASNTMGMIAFVDDAFNGGLTAQGVGSLQILHSSLKIGTNFSLTNSFCNWLDSDMNTGTASIVWNGGLAAPAGDSVTVFELISWAFNPNTFTISANSFVVAQTLNVGNPSHTISVSGSLQLINGATALGNITVANGGQLLTLNPASIQGTLTIQAGGTYTPSGSINLGALTFATLPAAASNPGVMFYITDSTTLTTEGQNCAGSGTVTALAFSNGSVWKCF